VSESGHGYDWIGLNVKFLETVVPDTHVVVGIMEGGDAAPFWFGGERAAIAGKEATTEAKVCAKSKRKELPIRAIRN